jgi:hypothetical protein
MRVVAESAGSVRQIVTRSQLVSVSRSGSQPVENTIASLRPLERPHGLERHQFGSTLPVREC